MINLSDGLDDLSKELGETNTNTTARRIGHYNDAIVDFANDRKWPFLIKKNNELTSSSNTKTYNIPAGMSDARWPGAIHSIYVGDDTDPFLPIDYEQRGDASLQGDNFFYVDPEVTQIIFLSALDDAKTITIHYFYIPARTTDTTNGTFPIPDRYRKVIATLAGAYVQWSRYLESQGNRLYNIYTKMLGNTQEQQAEQPKNKPNRLKHYLQFRGFKRTYP